MPAYRFFLKGKYAKGQECVLEGSEHHHLVHVMRRKVGDLIELVNGEGELAFAEVVRINRKDAVFRIKEVHTSPRTKKKIILAQAIPRGNRLDTIIEKGTELGMTDLWLFPGDLSERKKLLPKAIDKMEGAAIAAMKQCGRLDLPRIEFKPHFSKWEVGKELLYFGDLDPDAPSLVEAMDFNSSKNIVFFVGPESGFTEDEVGALKKAGAVGVKLHDNILRTDTASIVALTLISHGILMHAQ